MQILSTQHKASAAALKDKIEARAAKIKQHDQKDADLSSKPDEILLSSDKKTVPLDKSTDVLSAQVKYEDGELSSADMQLAAYFSSSKNGGNLETLSKETITEKTGFLGLVGPEREVDVYSYKKDHYFNTNNVKAEARFDQDGNAISYKEKEYASTFGEGVLEVVTTPAGIGLTVFAAALGGVPGTLGHLLMGPAGALVTASLTVGGLAYYKTKPW